MSHAYISILQGSWTALMEASDAGHANIVKLLLDAGAIPNEQKKVIMHYKLSCMQPQCSLEYTEYQVRKYI